MEKPTFRKQLPVLPRLNMAPRMPAAHQHQLHTSRLHTSSLDYDKIPRSKDKLSTLLPELLLHIISFLDDEIASACLGLASYRLYLHHFSVHGKVRWNAVRMYTVEMKHVLGPMVLIMPFSLKTMVRAGLEGRVWNQKARAWLWEKEKEKEVEGVNGTDGGLVTEPECGANSEETSGRSETGLPGTSDRKDIGTGKKKEERKNNKRSSDEMEVTEAKRARLDATARSMTLPIRQRKASIAGIPDVNGRREVQEGHVNDAGMGPIWATVASGIPSQGPASDAQTIIGTRGLQDPSRSTRTELD